VSDKKLRGKFKEHELVRLAGRVVEGDPVIRGGERCFLFRCIGHCDWIGWIPARLTEEG